MSDEMREALDAVVQAAEDGARRESILAFMEATRTHPHPECVIPYFQAILLPAMAADPVLVELAEIGSTLLACND